MGNRLSKIYTRTGDKGTTGLADGSRIDKDSALIETIGDVDELNSCIGIVLSQELPVSVRHYLTIIQHDLFDLGGELSIPGQPLIKQAHIDELEQHLDNLNENLPSLKEFILPAGNLATSSCHLARSVCRRAERHCVSLQRTNDINPLILTYLNRLSDLLFVCARVIARQQGGEEVYWNRNKIGKRHEK